MGKERVALKRLNHCNHAIMAANPKVVPLGDIMGEDDPRALANSREHR
jgi:hypothetical protein